MLISYINSKFFYSFDNKNKEFDKSIKELEIHLKIFNQTLWLFVETKPFAYFSKIRIGVHEFKNKLLITTQGHKREIIIEIDSFTEKQTKEINTLIASHNQRISYKNPLQLNFSCNESISLLSTSNDRINLKGFIHMLVVYTVIGYSKSILESFIKHGDIFSASVI